MIAVFDGEYTFLSNFYERQVVYQGLTYGSSEAAFQAQKTASAEERQVFTTLTPMQSKKMGRKITLRPDWEEVKTQVMYEIILAKFTQNTDLAEKLIATGDQELVEGNYWKDTCWGVCNGVGENRLGKILMRVREEIK